MWKNSHVNLCSCHNAFFVLTDTSPSSRAGNLLLVQPSGPSSTTCSALSLLLLTKRLKASTSHMPWKTMSRMCHQKWTLLGFYLKSITALFQTSLTPTYNYIDFPETAHRSWHTEIKTFMMRCGIKQRWQPSQKSLENHAEADIQKKMKNIHDDLRYQTRVTTMTEIIEKSFKNPPKNQSKSIKN